MTSCCPPPRMRWSGATDAIARCKRVSTGCGRKRRSVRAWRWICGVKPKPKAGNKPLHHCIVHGLDKPGSSATVSIPGAFFKRRVTDSCAIPCHHLVEKTCMVVKQNFSEKGQQLHSQFKEILKFAHFGYDDKKISFRQESNEEGKQDQSVCQRRHYDHLNRGMAD